MCDGSYDEEWQPPYNLPDLSCKPGPWRWNGVGGGGSRRVGPAPASEARAREREAIEILIVALFSQRAEEKKAVEEDNGTS